MQRLKDHLRRSLWPVAALAAVSLHFWFPETPTGVEHDSYSVTAAGQKAFYRLIAAQPSNDSLSRNRRPLATELQSLSTEHVLCILGPQRSPTPDEWTALVDWVRNGGSLLYAFHGEQPQEVPWLNVKYLPEPPSGDDLEPRTHLVASAKLAWWTDGRLKTSGGGNLVDYDGGVQAVQLHYGFGRAVFVATALPFSNQLLSFGDNSVLAMRLLEAAGPPRFVVVDESLNHSGSAKVVGILFDPLLRPISIQVLIVTLLFGWWQSRRFGPMTPVAVSPRQNIVEHSDMVGNWYWKSRDGRPALVAYLKQLTLQLRLKSFKGNEDRVLEPIALRAGRDPAALRQDLQQAYQAVRAKRVDRRTAAKLLRRLSLIRRDAAVNERR